MKKRIMITLALLATTVILSACGEGSTAQATQVMAANNPTIANPQSGISASQARAMAIDIVGGGSMQGLETITVNGDVQFMVSVDYNGNTYDVVLDAQSGNFVSLRLVEEQIIIAEAASSPGDLNVVPDYPPHVPYGNVVPNYPPHVPYNNITPDYPAHHQEPHHQPITEPNADTVVPVQASSSGETSPPAQPVAQVGNINIPANITPRPPARSGGPSSPAISAQRAVELARDHLISIGVTSARFDYVYMDIENGIWVWSVEFDGQGRSYEFYVNVDTGAFVQAPRGSAASQSSSPPPASSPSPQSSPSSSPSPTSSPSSSPRPTSSPSSGGGSSRPSNPAISLDRAIEIGYAELARRGHSGTFRNHSGMDFEPRYGGWVWELLFRVPGGRLPLVEMYIDVNTGNVAKFEWDD